MVKLGRNQPCPCGSGKKFKKCCLNRPGPVYRVARAIHWSPEEIEAFSTDQIIRKLQSFGVGFTREQFLKDVERFYSAEEMAEHWWGIYPVTAWGLDEDFIWMAAMVLWDRLAPHIPSSEKLDNMMQRGYDLIEDNRLKEGCILWLEVWDHLKGRFPPGARTIEEAERVFNGTQSLVNWCPHLEMELGNAGLEDKSFYEKRIKYCQEFCSLFPQSGDHLIGSMKRAVAESYFALGMLEQGEKAFGALTKEFPDWAWGYIGWADMYWLFRVNKDKVPLNYEKAETIYRMALDRDVDEEDKKHILDRLAGLGKERGLTT